MTRSQLRRIAVAVLIAIVGLTGTTALGFWQYSRAHRDDIAKQVWAASAVPVQTLVEPGSYVPESAFTHSVAVRGTWLASASVLSCNRLQADGSRGCWVLSPVRFGDSGRAITVALGFVDEANASTELATARARGDGLLMDVTGRLQPGEVFDRGKAILRPTDRLDYISVNELAMLWGTNLFDGYVVMDGAAAGSHITASLIAPPSGITWRNLFYAWQWWAFAAFVLFLLVRYVTDVVREPSTIAAEETVEGQ